MAKRKKGLYSLYEVSAEAVVPVPSFQVNVVTETLIDVNLTFDEALEEAGQQALNHQKRCLIREQ